MGSQHAAAPTAQGEIVAQVKALLKHSLHLKSQVHRLRPWAAVGACVAATSSGTWGGRAAAAFAMEAGGATPALGGGTCWGSTATIEDLQTSVGWQTANMYSSAAMIGRYGAKALRHEVITHLQLAPKPQRMCFW